MDRDKYEGLEWLSSSLSNTFPITTIVENSYDELK